MGYKKALTNEQFQRLLPFFFWRHSRQRVLLYLLAAGYSIKTLRHITVQELQDIPVHDEIKMLINEIVENSPASAMAFIFKENRKISYSYFYRLIGNSCLKTLGKKLTYQQFRDHIKGLPPGGDK